MPVAPTPAKVTGKRKEPPPTLSSSTSTSSSKGTKKGQVERVGTDRVYTVDERRWPCSVSFVFK